MNAVLGVIVAIGLLLGAGAAGSVAQEPAGRGQPPAGRGAPPIGPRPFAGPPDRPGVDEAAAARGRTTYNAECASCHGPSARGTDSGPSLLRSIVVLNDRFGSLLGPFFKKGHPMRSGRPSAELTEPQIIELMHFLRQRINDTLRGSDVFDVQNILTGDATAGAAYFNGEGKCTACHSPTGDLAGIATRIPAPVDVQQRMLFPGGRGGGGRGRGGAGAAPSRSTVTATITSSTGAAQSGVLIEEDDFHVTFRDAAGIVRVVRKTAGLKVTTTNPLAAHHELLDRITDKNIHDLVAYLETLK